MEHRWLQVLLRKRTGRERLRVIFPEYYDEAGVEKYARQDHGIQHPRAGQKYRYCFEGRKFRFDRYDKMFVYEKAEESVLMASKIAGDPAAVSERTVESAKRNGKVSYGESL